MKNAASFFVPGLLVLALIVFLAAPQVFAPVFRPLVQANAPAIYTQANLLSLTLSHLAIVGIATGLATLVAGALAVLVTRPSARIFCRCRAASSILARPFRRWRFWRLRCR